MAIVWGGADTQNFASYLLEQVAYQRMPEFDKLGDYALIDLRYKSFDHIVGVDIFTKNSAGVPTSTQKRLARSINKLKSLKNQDSLNIKIKHMMIEGDLIQGTGECHIGADLRPEDADVSIINIHTCSKTSYLSRHTGQYLGSNNMITPMGVEKISNQTEKGLKRLKTLIGEVPKTILHNRQVKLIQHYAYRFLKPVTSILSLW